MKILKGILLAVMSLLMLLTGCGSKPASVTLTIAAAASLEHSIAGEIIPLFTEAYPHITVEGTYDSSGKLQTQIEQGLEADIFFSAAMKQMNALIDQGLMGDFLPLLENKLVLIKTADLSTPVTGFENILEAPMIAIGDPESVPVGQYAQEAFTALGIWDDVLGKASLGTNVTEVLNWVAEGSAEVGVVYATDAATTDKVTVVAEAPEGTLAQPVLYPGGIVAASAHPEEAKLLMDFLQTDAAKAVFEKYGFTTV